MDTSQGAPGVRPWLVVECGICRSNSLSHSMMNATSTWESKADSGKRPVTAPVTVPVSPPVRVPVTLPVSAAGRGPASSTPAAGWPAGPDAVAARPGWR